MAHIGISSTGRAPQTAGKNRLCYPPRTLHLIDVENLAGNPVPDQLQVRELRAIYATRVGFGAMDQVVVACNHLAIRKTGYYWPGARYLVRSGPDGADLELLDVIFHENIAARFSSVTIASGDGAFAWAAAEFAASGCKVTVVSRRASLSKRLAIAAQRVVYIDTPDAATAAVFALRPDAA
jgi:hypothetical protein